MHMDPANNRLKTAVVLSRGSNAYAFIVEMDGKKIFTWDQGFLPLPAHDNVEQFIEEIMSVAADLCEFHPREIENCNGVKVRDALRYALQEWPNKNDITYGSMKFTMREKSSGFARASCQFFCARPSRGSHSPLERHPLSFANPSQTISSK